jgi:hypothetical protein
VGFPAPLSKRSRRADACTMKVHASEQTDDEQHPQTQRINAPPTRRRRIRGRRTRRWGACIARCRPRDSHTAGIDDDAVAVKSSSPSPPSVMLKLTVLPLKLAGNEYQCGVVSLKVGPYLYSLAPTGGALGRVSVNLRVAPPTQPLAVKSTKPWGKLKGIRTRHLRRHCELHLVRRVVCIQKDVEKPQLLRAIV